MARGLLFLTTMLGFATTPESILLLLFLGLILAVGFQGNRSDTIGTISYFYAGQSTRWLTLAVSLMSTAAVAEGIVLVAGWGTAESLIALTLFILLASLASLLVLGPRMLSDRLLSIPELLERRFGSTVRRLSFVLGLLLLVVFRLSVLLFLASRVLPVVGLDTSLSVVTLVTVVGLYTVAGGLDAVLKTQRILAIAVIVTCGLLLWVMPVTGFSIRTALTASLGSLPSGWTLSQAWPLLAVLLFSHWTTDHSVMQRILSANSVRDVHRSASLSTAVLLLLLLGVLLLPEGEVVAPAVGGKSAPPALLGSAIGAAWSGVFRLGVLSYLMASLSSIIHSTGALTALEIGRHRGPTRTEQRQVLSGRLVSVVVVLLAIVGGNLFQSVGLEQVATLILMEGVVVVPILVVVFLGALWQRMNSVGALLTLTVPILFGGGLLVAMDVAPVDWLGTLTPTTLLSVVFGSSVMLLVVGSALGSLRSLRRDESLTEYQKAKFRSVQ